MNQVSTELRLVLWSFALLALIAGGLLFFGGNDTESWFSWTIAPPLTAAFLGASYWAAFVLLAWSALQRDWLSVRAALPPVLVIAVLLLVATLIHLDRFDFDSLFGWFWLIAYMIVPPLLVVVIARQLRHEGGRRDEHLPLPEALRALLALQGLTMVVVGAALFAAPARADEIWPWPLSPLTARAVGAFVLGFGVSALHAVIENDRYRFRGAAYAYTVLGALQLLALAIHAEDLTGGSLDSWLYAGFLIGVLGTGAYGSARAAEPA